MLAILALGAAAAPLTTNASRGGYTTPYNSSSYPYYNYGKVSVNTTGVITTPYGATADDYYTPPPVKADNPKPTINSISPTSSNIGVGVKTITIKGSGFVPESIVRVNGANRATTYIDGYHLLLQISGNDTYAYLNDGGFFITIYNGAPGGGFSNAAFFKINKIASPTGTANPDSNYGNNANNTGTSFIDAIPESGVVGDSDRGLKSLAAGAIFGSAGSILPSGLIQWIFFAILVLLIIILVRRVFGAEKNYLDSPLKHK